jgi:5-methylcytosine-specific restriction endonuclease McrA|tara:strand:+ start:641 stop:1132 length:492 start_codon:yes stop_codon:yes gene_type:complete
MEVILVLNADYSPINITGLQRAFNLVYLKKAEVVQYNNNPIITEKRKYKRPAIIRLLRYVSIPFRKVPLSRENVFRRDRYHCLYCGSKKNLTIDHVIPRSKGGKNDWKNLATCCKSCNIKKDNKDLDEVELELEYLPYKPTYIQFVKNININKKKNWLPYLLS